MIFICGRHFAATLKNVWVQVTFRQKLAWLTGVWKCQLKAQWRKDAIKINAWNNFSFMKPARTRGNFLLWLSNLAPYPLYCLTKAIVSWLCFFPVLVPDSIG